MSATYPPARGRANAFAGRGAWLLMIIRNVSKPPLLTRENSAGQSSCVCSLSFGTYTSSRGRHAASGPVTGSALVAAR